MKGGGGWKAISLPPSGQNLLFLSVTFPLDKEFAVNRPRSRVVSTVRAMAEQGGRYTPSVYLSVTDDANRWRAGPPQPKQLTNESKVS